MGIKGLMLFLRDLAPSSIREINMSTYSGRIVAIDAPLFIYKFLIAVRQGQESENLSNSSGDTTSHLSGFFYQVIKLLEHGIKPVYVFDGKSPEMKQAVINERKQKVIDAQHKLDAMNVDAQSTQTTVCSIKIDLAKDVAGKAMPLNNDASGIATNNTTIPHAQAQAQAQSQTQAQAQAQMQAQEIQCRRKTTSSQTVRMTHADQQDVIKLLRLLGIPVVEAPGEAEAQCAHMCKQGLAYATITEDMDTLTFGTSKLLRGYSNTALDQSMKRKSKVGLGKKSAARSVETGASAARKCKPIEEIDLAKLLDELKLSMEQFVDLSILCGCDYTSTLPGIGPKTAYKLIKEHKTIEEILKNTTPSGKQCKKNKKFSVSNTVPGGSDMPTFQYKEASKLFLEPDVFPTDHVKKQLIWRPIQEQELVAFLVTQKQFNQSRVMSALERAKNSSLTTAKNQGRLDSFFSVKK